MTKQFIVGANDCSPKPDSTKFISEFFKHCFVNFIIMDNLIINQLTPSPQFIHNYMEGFISIAPLTFIVGSKIIFDITPVQPCFV